MRKTINNKQFAIALVATQLVQAMAILSCRYPDIHFLCLVNILASIMIIFKYLSDNE